MFRTIVGIQYHIQPSVANGTLEVVIVAKVEEKRETRKSRSFPSTNYPITAGKFNAQGDLSPFFCVVKKDKKKSVKPRRQRKFSDRVPR